jgi:prepilin-type N-terminal cleavage/methylation domain-containing protein
MNCRQPIFDRHRRLRAFTLIEVMISIALALVLILGVSQIFGIAQRTTGAGNAVLIDTETSRAVAQTFTNDFRAIANDTSSPGLVIVSYSAAAFRNKADQSQDRDADPRTFNDPNGTGSLPLTHPSSMITAVNSHIHRQDRVCFFERDQFSRQTGNSSTVDPGISLTSMTTSNEAFVWIGHLALPNNQEVANWTTTNPGPNTAGSYFSPGQPAVNTTTPNDNNLFASDWILGREVILLTPTANGEIGFNGPNPTSSATKIRNGLSLLATNNRAVGTNVFLYASRYDLDFTSMSLYRTFIGTSKTWWQDLAGVTAAGTTRITKDQRYFGNPFLRKPTAGTTGNAAAQWMSAAVAQTSPIFVRGCTQFIVEFAGDFVTQNTAGAVTSAVPDGQIDYVADPTTGARKIRWYGFSRDTNDDGVINPQQDVVPLCTLLGSSTPASAFERVVPTGTWVNGIANEQATRVSRPYVCAWGPDTDAAGIPRPKMIRITMAVDDPAGHLNSEQTYEYVYNLP